MKKLQLIINVVLAAAVVALFVLQFVGESEKSEAADAVEETDSMTVAHTGNIAYFNMDSVLVNWNLFFEMQQELDAKQKQMEAEFSSKTQAFQKRVEDAQYKMQRGLVTRAEAEELGQQLQVEEQSLLNLQNNYTVQLQEEGVVKNRQMIDKIEQYLKKFNQDKGYSFIFSYTFGGNLMYGDRAMDITDEVIEGINKEYPSKE
jgi:outer membrane protein